MNDSLIIDTHLHPIADDFERYPLRQRDRAGRGWSETPMSTEAMLGQMQAAGVSGAVLVQSTAVYGFDNSYIADSIVAHPGRCAGMCAIDQAAADAPDVLTHWVQERGVHGWRVTDRNLADPAGIPVWEKARELGLPVAIQMQPEGLGALADLLERFGEVPVALDHAANVNRPERDPADVRARTEELIGLARFPNLYLKLTSQNFDGVVASGAPAEAYLAPIVKAYGVERLMWGTDYPATGDKTYADRLQQTREALAFLSPEEQAWVFGRSALKLWPSLGA